ncbi:MAG: TIGR03545 family protein [Desulforegulaceae bacterium]|nr:TIGR03545 family protein [Desulforegulaceae bacterium]
MKKFLKKIFKFFLYLIGFFLLLLLILYFLRNIILDFAIEKGGSKINKAKVEVFNVDLDIFSQSISWDKLEAADRNDPWKNIFETGFTEFKIQIMPLTDGKFIIDNMVIKDVQSNTKRKTNGSLPQYEKSLKDDEKPSWIKDFALKQIEKEKEAIPVLNKELFKDFSDTDKIIEQLDLETPKKVDEARLYFEERKIFWKNHFEKRNYEQRSKEIQNDFKEIKSFENKKPEEILKSIEKIQDLKEKCESFKNDLKEDRKLAALDLEKANQYKKDFSVWVNSDYEKAKNAINIKDGGLEKISEMLFGKRLTLAGEKLVGLIAQIREAGRKSSEKEKPEKVKVDKYPHLPKFWIKSSQVSVLAPGNTYSFKGEVLNISSDQNKTGQPITLDFLHNDEKTGKISFNGIIDFRDSNDLLSFEFDLKGFILKNLKLTSEDLLSLVIKDGKSDIKASFVSKPRLIKSLAKIKIHDHIFDRAVLEKNPSKLEQLVFEAVESAEVIDIGIILTLEDNTKNISVNSSLGSVVSSRVNDYIKQKAKAEIKKVETGVNLKIDEKRKEFVSFSEEGSVLENILHYEVNLKTEEEKLNREKEELEKKIKGKIDDKKNSLLENLKIKL